MKRGNVVEHGKDAKIRRDSANSRTYGPSIIKLLAAVAAQVASLPVSWVSWEPPDALAHGNSVEMDCSVRVVFVHL